jgi:hypothetical protein
MHSRLEANLCQKFPHDHAAEAVQSLENLARYRAQSRFTRDGERAELPERAPVPLFVFHYED